MLFGSLRINLWSGIFGFVLTFLLSTGKNLLVTSFIRGIIAFVVWFILAYLVRWVIGYVSRPDLSSAGLSNMRQDGQEEGLGTNLDLVTPDEGEDLNNMLKPKPEPDPAQAAFTPLNPPKLVTTKEPEELAKAVRHLTDQ